MDTKGIDRVKHVVYVSLAIFVAIQLARPHATILNNMELTALLTFLVAVFYVRWGWRINPCEKHPKLYPTYYGVLISDYDGKERPLTLHVKQTLLDIKVTIETNESKSSAFVSGIYEEHGVMKLSYGYLNHPNAVFRDKSEIHYGMCSLDISEVANLNGSYFTDRRTKGDIKLAAVIRMKTRVHQKQP